MAHAVGCSVSELTPLWFEDLTARPSLGHDHTANLSEERGETHPQRGLWSTVDKDTHNTSSRLDVGNRGLGGAIDATDDPSAAR
jgi:hypothetical protein